MKHTIALLFLSLIIACNENPKKEAVGNTDTVQVSTKQSEGNAMTSGDYSTLFTSYKCTMEISEVAEVLNVRESDLVISDTKRENACSFDLHGFSENNIRKSTQISWGPLPTSKAQNKKEIASYLERKKEGLKIMGMDIELAKTGDCYIAYQPAHGRVIIYNENYDTAFLLNYGRKNTYKRTAEQHEALRLKMTDLANYLLQEHRK